MVVGCVEAVSMAPDRRRRMFRACSHTVSARALEVYYDATSPCEKAVSEVRGSNACMSFILWRQCLHLTWQLLQSFFRTLNCVRDFGTDVEVERIMG